MANLPRATEFSGAVRALASPAREAPARWRRAAIQAPAPLVKTRAH
jgi:hypothetical protein